MATITMKFEFSNGLEAHEETMGFLAKYGMERTISDYADNFVSDLNAEQVEEEWKFTDSSIDYYDTEYKDQKGPDQFDGLDEWGQYCEDADSADSHAYRYGGDAFVARYNDTGDCDIDDFVGTYHSFEQYAAEYADDCMDIPDHLRDYFDYATYANDLRWDYSIYPGGEGVLIFRD